MNNRAMSVFLFSLALLVMSTDALAQASGGLSLDRMFANFTSSGEAVTRLIKYSSYIIGLFLVIASVFKFIQVAQSNGQVTIKVPIVMFLSGIGIFALTAAVSIVTNTMVMGSGPGAILAPSMSGPGKWTSEGLVGVMVFIRMVGYIAFIRGFLLLNQYGQGKEGTIGRGLTHIFGGVAAINIQETAKILAATFAPGTTLPF